MGRSDVNLKLQILKILSGSIILIITLPFGLYIVMIGNCVGSIIGSFINASPKLLGDSYLEQVKDMFPLFLLSLGMAAIVLCIGMLPLHPLLLMIIQVIVGTGVYFAGAKLFKFECFEYVLNTVKDLKKKK